MTPLRDRTYMARLDVDRPISTQPMWILYLFMILGILPSIFLWTAEVADECGEEIDRRRGRG